MPRFKKTFTTGAQRRSQISPGMFQQNIRAHTLQPRSDPQTAIWGT